MHKHGQERFKTISVLTVIMLLDFELMPAQIHFLAYPDYIQMDFGKSGQHKKHMKCKLDRNILGVV